MPAIIPDHCRLPAFPGFTNFYLLSLSRTELDVFGKLQLVRSFVVWSSNSCGLSVIEFQKAAEALTSLDLTG